MYWQVDRVILGSIPHKHHVWKCSTPIAHQEVQHRNTMLKSVPNYIRKCSKPIPYQEADLPRLLPQIAAVRRRGRDHLGTDRSAALQDVHLYQICYFWRYVSLYVSSICSFVPELLLLAVTLFVCVFYMFRPSLPFVGRSVCVSSISSSVPDLYPASLCAVQ